MTLKDLVKFAFLWLLVVLAGMIVGGCVGAAFVWALIQMLSVLGVSG